MPTTGFATGALGLSTGARPTRSRVSRRYFRLTRRLFDFVFAVLAQVLHWFHRRRRGVTGADFLDPLSRFRLLNAHNDGLLLDGSKLRLSASHSCQSLIAYGGVGSGKSSSLVIPNCLTANGASLVIADTSGENYAATSGYLAAIGYDIAVFDLMQPRLSLQYNPCLAADSFAAIKQAAQVIVHSSPAMQGAADPFWAAGAAKIIAILMRALANHVDPGAFTLANVKQLLNHFDAHLFRQRGCQFDPAATGDSQSLSRSLSLIDRFMVEATVADPATFSEYRGFTIRNERAMTSILATADIALDALADPQLASLTARSSFAFANLRSRPTALYVKVRQQDMGYYAFLLNLFYTDLVNALLADLADAGRPVYLLLDEFGHLTIPEFDTFAATARKYRVGFFLFLQSPAQLEKRYGRDGAAIIRDSVQTEIFLKGLKSDHARELSERLGTYRLPYRQDGFIHHRSYPLMEPYEITRLADDEALLLHANKPPLKLKLHPYFRQKRLRQRAALPPCVQQARPEEPLECVGLSDYAAIRQACQAAPINRSLSDTAIGHASLFSHP